MSTLYWGPGRLALSQSADSATPVSRRRCERFDSAAMLAAAAAYQCVCIHYKAQAHPPRFQSRVSPVTLFSRTGSALPPSHQYISLDLEDFQ